MTPWNAACQASSDKWKNTEFHILVCITVSYCQNIVTKKFNSVKFVVVLFEGNEMTGAGLHSLVTWTSSSPRRNPNPSILSCHFTLCLNQWFKTSGFTPAKSFWISCAESAGNLLVVSTHFGGLPRGTSTCRGWWGCLPFLCPALLSSWFSE